MTAKEAKEKSNKAYFEMQEKRLNDKIKSVNDAIEALNIEKTVKDITDNTDYDYIVINDCSKDNTAEVCRKNSFNLISLPVNYGLTSAIPLGMKYAYEHNYDIVVQFDGDANFEAAEYFIDELEQFHFVEQ